jgi:hypothetical protein
MDPQQVAVGLVVAGVPEARAPSEPAFPAASLQQQQQQQQQHGRGADVEAGQAQGQPAFPAARFQS